MAKGGARQEGRGTRGGGAGREGRGGEAREVCEKPGRSEKEVREGATSVSQGETAGKKWGGAGMGKSVKWG